ncbi:Eukaryotic translation initiation factor 4B [Hyphomicrobiales bacterium]|nr:Eukaryotic translation initiation factor 4B [Hyphomicrobiales bacterium]CAH1672029.1 Eukaryotic translation initiation factor 4B [Hyphomicrobiales bacterium]
MRSSLIIGAIFALTTFPALAQDMSGAGNRGWDERRGYGRDWRSDRDDRGDRADRQDRDEQRDWRSSMHEMRDHERGDQDMSGGGSGFLIRSGDIRLAVRCGDRETMRSCVDAALMLFDRVQSRATAEKPAAGNPQTAPNAQ